MSKTKVNDKGLNNKKLTKTKKTNKKDNKQIIIESNNELTNLDDNIIKEISISKLKKNNTNPNESTHFEFNTLRRNKQIINPENESVQYTYNIKKRRTIKMDENLDLSTDSLEKTLDSEHTLKLVIPEPKKNVKTYEIYKTINSDNINELIGACLRYLKSDISYSRQILKNCEANYFSDIDYRKEIENVQNKTVNFKIEIEKWNNIFEELKSNKIEIYRLSEDTIQSQLNSCTFTRI